VSPFLPQTHADVKKFNKIQNELLGNIGTATYGGNKGGDGKGGGARGGGKSGIPSLNIAGTVRHGEDPHENNAGVIGWRKLPRPEIPKKFFEKCLQTKTLGPDLTSGSSGVGGTTSGRNGGPTSGPTSGSNRGPNPVFLIPLSPVEACQYEPMTFTVDIESIFIPDARKDMDRVLANIERNIEREEELSKNIPTNELLLFGKAEAMTSVDNFVANQYKYDKEMKNMDPIQEAIEKAILAAKTSNIAEMEDALDEATGPTAGGAGGGAGGGGGGLGGGEVSVETADQYGNTLLILAAQQGSKKMVRYLLRRGANVNAQSLSGQTALHYCFAYSHQDLGRYLIEKVLQISRTLSSPPLSSLSLLPPLPPPPCLSSLLSPLLLPVSLFSALHLSALHLSPLLLSISIPHLSPVPV
jgi:hypothetical protein